jgi:hypothetical protein
MRDELEAWTEALAATQLPLVTAGDPPRARIALGPPLPGGATANDEPLDLTLTRSRTIGDVRAAVEQVVPEGHELRALHDVWVGAPALAAAGRAADYRIRLDAASSVDHDRMVDAARDLLALPRIERPRRRGPEGGTYDLRPLLEDIVVEPDAILVRARVDQERGVGRPEEVVAALGERLDRQVSISGIARFRVWLVDDPAPDPLATHGDRRRNPPSID